ncbi:MAG: hypothetical protein EG823_01725 [Actinobacteria bacterium]|nr:hypothetical protein [Actinomycetota bacterium]
MTERPDFEAMRGSYWRSLSRRRRWAYVAGAAAFALVAVAGALAASAARGPAQAPGGETSRTIVPAEETSETTLPVRPGADTAANEQEPVADTGTAAPAQSEFVRAALVSYRRDGWLCVAAEDGSGERRVAASAAGVQTLSPDGTLIAFVDAGTGALALADTASGVVVAIGPALQDPPSWAPDSAWLAYTAPGPSVLRVARDGSGAAELFAGEMPSVSVADGTVVGLAPTGEISVWRAGALTRLRASRTVTGIAADGATIFFGAMAADGAASLRAIGATGQGERTLVGAPDSERAVTLGDMLLSPDATHLVYAERGDDGYSRMFAVPTAGGAPASLCVRRECYPLRWTADGDGVLFIEGNALQGDPTALMRAQSTGDSRRFLVDGAAR